MQTVTVCRIKGEIDNDELSQPSEAIDHSGMEEIEDDLGSTGCNFSADDTPPDHPDQLPEFSSKDFTPEQAEQFDALDDQMVELECVTGFCIFWPDFPGTKHLYFVFVHVVSLLCTH